MDVRVGLVVLGQNFGQGSREGGQKRRRDAASVHFVPFGRRVARQQGVECYARLFDIILRSCAGEGRRKDVASMASMASRGGSVFVRGGDGVEDPRLP